MAKIENPTLFQIVFALNKGFHSLDLLYAEPHYVRVVAEGESGTLVVEVLPADLLSLARAYKPSAPRQKWWTVKWWEDALLAQKIRTFIFEHIGSLDQQHTFRIGRNNKILQKER